MEDTNPKNTPSSKDPLIKYLHGSSLSQEFNYTSIVGMMMYLCNNSRPEIAFAVNLFNRYTHHPTCLKAAKVSGKIPCYLPSKIS